MMNPSRWKVVVVALATLFGVFFTLPNLLPATVRDHLPAFLPHQTLKLGLDLQGGSSLLLSVDGDALRKERITNLIEDARSSLKEAGIAFTDLGQTGPDVTVRINDPSQIGPAMNALRKSVAPATQGAAGGREVSLGQAADQRIRLSFSQSALDAETARAVEQSIEIIRRRIDQMGTKEPDIRRQGSDRILVQVAGESDPERLKNVIGQTAKLSFQMVDEQASPEDLAAGRVPPGDEILPSTDGIAPQYVVKKRQSITGEMLTNAQAGFDQQGGKSQVQFRMNGIGSQRFADITRQNIGKPSDGKQ